MKNSYNVAFDTLIHEFFVEPVRAVLVIYIVKFRPPSLHMILKKYQ